MTTVDTPPGRRDGERARPRAPFARVVTVLAAVSGLAVSVQVVAWLRLTRVLFESGSRSAALAGTLAAVALGVGVGALLGSRLIDRRADRLRFLAALHLLLGVYTVVSPRVLTLPVDLFTALWRGGEVPGLVGPLGILLAFVGLLPGTALIGALIPATMRVTTGVWSRVGRTLGRTAASAIGGMAVGAMIWGLGLWTSIGVGLTACLWAAAVAHLAVGAVIARLGAVAVRRGQVVDTQAEGTVTRLRRRDRLSPRLRAVAVVGAASAGLAAGGYRLLLAPLLAAQLSDRPTSLVLALGVALAGAALGAWFCGRLIDYRRDRTIWVAGALTVAGWAALWAAATLPGIASEVDKWAFAIRSRPAGEAVTLVAALAPVAICLGAAWPALCRVFVKDLAHVGAHTGLAAAAWCGGAATAAVAVGAAGQVVGCQGPLLVYALILSAAGAALVLVDFGLGGRLRVLCVAAIVVATGSAALLQPGGVRYGLAPADEHPLVFYRESLGAVTSVAQSPRRERWLIVNGRRAGGTAVAWSAPALASAHVPMTIHPQADLVLVLGHRTGAAVSRAASFAGVSRIEIVEPLDGIDRAGSRFQDVFPPPPIPIKIAHRRSIPRGFVVGSTAYFDVVIVNGLHPGTLLGAGGYSHEYLAACSAHLRRSGLLVLRVPIEGLDLIHLRSIVGTFRGAFGHAQLWWVPVQRREVMLLGSRVPIDMDLARMAERLAACRVSPGEGLPGGGDPLSLTGWLVAAGSALDDLAGSAPIETDERPRLAAQISRASWLRRDSRKALRSILQALAGARSASRNERLRALSSAGPPPNGAGPWAPDTLRAILDRFDRSWERIVAGHRAELAGDQQTASEHYTEALSVNPEDQAAFFLLGQVAGRERAGELLRGLSGTVREEAPDRQRLARLYRRLGLHAEAADQLKQAVGLSPENADLWTDLGEVYVDLDRGQAAAEALTEALSLEPGSIRARLARADLRMRGRQWATAEADWRAIVDRAATGQALRRAHVQLGLCHLEQGLTQQAIAQLERARGIAPGAVEGLTALARAYEAAGRLQDALNTVNEARRGAPDDQVLEALFHRLRRRLATQPAYR